MGICSRRGRGRGRESSLNDEVAGVGELEGRVERLSGLRTDGCPRGCFGYLHWEDQARREEEEEGGLSF